MEECRAQRERDEVHAFRFVSCVWGYLSKLHCVHFHFDPLKKRERESNVTERSFCSLASSTRVRPFIDEEQFYPPIAARIVAKDGKSQIFDFATWAKSKAKNYVWVVLSTFISLANERQYQLTISVERLYRARASAHINNSLQIG